MLSIFVLLAHSFASQYQYLTCLCNVFFFFIIRNSSLSVCHLLALREIHSSFGHKSLSSKEIHSGELNVVLGMLTAHLLLSDVIPENDVILSRDQSLSHFRDSASWYRQRFSSYSMKKKVKKWKNMNASRYSGGRIYYRCVGEHGQRWEHLGESRVDTTRLNCSMWGGGRGRESGEKGTSYSSQEAQKNVGVTTWLN